MAVGREDGHGRWQVLMGAAQAGDAAAYHALLRECQPVIARFARQGRVPQQQVDDLVQEVLLTIHRSLQSYDPARPFLPWLRAIVQRRGIDVMRRTGRVAGRELHAPVAFEQEPDPARPADEAVLALEQERRLAAAVARLPEKQRSAVRELGLRQRSLAEVSAASGRSVTALKVTLHRAVKALRVEMAPIGA